MPDSPPLIRAHPLDRLKPFRFEQRTPGPGLHQRISVPERAIVKAPPAIGQSEHQIEPALPAASFHKNNQTLGAQQLPHVAQSLGKILRRMKNIRGQHDIEQSGFTRLILDIEHRDANARVRCELFLRLTNQRGRYIGKQVIGPIRRQRAQRKTPSRPVPPPISSTRNPRAAGSCRTTFASAVCTRPLVTFA